MVVHPGNYSFFHGRLDMGTGGRCFEENGKTKLDDMIRCVAMVHAEAWKHTLSNLP
jgi:hypothetical protein